MRSERIKENVEKTLAMSDEEIKAKVELHLALEKLVNDSRGKLSPSHTALLMACSTAQIAIGCFTDFQKAKEKYFALMVDAWEQIEDIMKMTPEELGKCEDKILKAANR